MSLEYGRRKHLGTPLCFCFGLILRRRSRKRRCDERPSANRIQTYIIMALSILLGACTTAPSRIVHDALPADSPKGYIEIYCSQCIAGWAIYREKDGQETHVAQLSLGRQVADTIRSPSRVKRLRVAHRPGSFDFIIRLLPRTTLDGSPPRFHLDIRQDSITPIRLEFLRETEERFQWDIVVGESLPMTPTNAMQTALATALEDADWGARWYAAQSLERAEEELSKPTLDRLQTLSSAETYNSCLGKATVIECFLIQDQARRVIKLKNP